MLPIRDAIVRRPAAFVGDVVGLGAILVLFAAALHLPALL